MMKNYCLLSIIALLTLVIPTHSTTIKDLKKRYNNRPDLLVACIEKHPHLLVKPSDELYYTELLTTVGQYSKSIVLSLSLFSKHLSYFHRGKLYFNLAKSYQSLGDLENSEKFFKKSLTRNLQHYFYHYAKFNEQQKNYSIALENYEKAFFHKSGKKDYILKAYSRTLHKGMIYYKNRNKSLYHSYKEIITKNPCLSQGKTRVLDNALIF